MRRSSMAHILMLVLTLLATAGAGAETPPATDTSDKIVVAGTLTTKDGAAVAGRSVFLFPVSGNQLNLDLKEGKLTNPAATTDSHGRFLLQAQGDYIKENQLFTVGMRAPNGELIVPERAGSSLILKLTKSGHWFDVGPVSVEK